MLSHILYCATIFDVLWFLTYSVLFPNCSLCSWCHPSNSLWELEKFRITQWSPKKHGHKYETWIRHGHEDTPFLKNLGHGYGNNMFIKTFMFLKYISFLNHKEIQNQWVYAFIGLKNSLMYFTIKFYYFYHICVYLEYDACLVNVGSILTSCN